MHWLLYYTQLKGKLTKIMTHEQNIIDQVTTARDRVITKFNNVRDRIEQNNAQPTTPTNRLLIDTELAKVVRDAKHINKVIDVNDYDICTISFVYTAYAVGKR